MTDYQKYQLQWMIDHGYGLNDLMQELRALQYDDPEDSDRISTPTTELFCEWEFDRGFGSEIWACEEEWKNCEESNWQDGDIYLNPYFGDLWVVDGASFIKINDGYEIELDEPEGFVKVGHISGVINKKEVPDLLSNHRKATNIQWDIDPEDDGGVALPNEITIPNDIEDGEAISDYISDVTGFCHKGFELEE
jgi:hypothetical protein